RGEGPVHGDRIQRNPRALAVRRSLLPEHLDRDAVNAGGKPPVEAGHAVPGRRRVQVGRPEADPVDRGGGETLRRTRHGVPGEVLAGEAERYRCVLQPVRLVAPAVRGRGPEYAPAIGGGNAILL